MEPIIINGELYHHGILGQHWGRQNGPPYPLGSGDHSAAEKRQAKRGVSTLAGYLKNKKIQKKRKAALEKARKVRQENIQKEAEAKKHAEEREKVLKSGNATEILKYQGEMTNDEMRRAIERIDLEKRLSDYSKKDIKTASDKVDEVMQKVGKATDWAEKGIRFYNVAAKIVNAYNEEDVMPPILNPLEKANYRSAVARAKQAEEQARAQVFTSQTLEEKAKQEKVKTKDAKKELKEKYSLLGKKKEPDQTQNNTKNQSQTNNQNQNQSQNQNQNQNNSNNSNNNNQKPSSNTPKTPNGPNKPKSPSGGLLSLNKPKIEDKKETKKNQDDRWKNIMQNKTNNKVKDSQGESLYNQQVKDDAARKQAVQQQAKRIKDAERNFLKQYEEESKRWDKIIKNKNKNGGVASNTDKKLARDAEKKLKEQENAFLRQIAASSKTSDPYIKSVIAQAIKNVDEANAELLEKNKKKLGL